jgi:hypothetical protein
MDKRKVCFFVIFVLLWVTSITSASVFVSIAEKEQETAGRGGQNKNSISLASRGEKRLMVLLRFDDLLCPLCTGSLLALCNALPEHIQKTKCWLVVMIDSVHFSEQGTKIISKKIEGFCKGNNLCLPVCIDFSHVFDPLGKGGSFILFLDGDRRTLERYEFPLDKASHFEVLNALLF